MTSTIISSTSSSPKINNAKYPKRKQKHHPRESLGRSLWSRRRLSRCLPFWRRRTHVKTWMNCTANLWWWSLSIRISRCPTRSCNSKRSSCWQPDSNHHRMFKQNHIHNTLNLHNTLNYYKKWKDRPNPWRSTHRPSKQRWTGWRGNFTNSSSWRGLRTRGWKKFFRRKVSYVLSVDLMISYLRS